MKQTILITGATGLIGSNLVRFFLDKSEYDIVACVRNVEKFNSIFTKEVCTGRINTVKSDLCSPVIYEGCVDYIIHCASITSSKDFVEKPVETINISFDGTRHMLELAREKQVKGFVYLSSMEVYGTPNGDELITENFGTDLNTMDVRSSYPEGKRMCEALCKAYQSEYGVPVRIARLTQTIGADIEYNDKRVFAEFARCVIEGKDIVLKTKGETKRSYVYVSDAVNAIYKILIDGQDGEAYNVANKSTYCSIYEMANLVAERCADSSISVRICEENIEKYGYAHTLHMNLDTSKIEALGWKPEIGLEEMFTKLIHEMRRLV